MTNVTTTTPALRGARSRQIGPLGTAGRVVVGVVLLGAAGAGGVGWLDALVGLGLANALVGAVPVLRGPGAPPLRLTGPGGHLLNAALSAGFFVVWPAAALLFIGSALLVAAARGFAACEILAVSNLVRRRDDRIGCPVFAPLDWAEERVTGRPRDC